MVGSSGARLFRTLSTSTTLGNGLYRGATCMTTSGMICKSSNIVVKNVQGINSLLFGSMHGHGLFGAIRSTHSTSSIDRDLYEVLGVTRNATPTELREVFCELTLKQDTNKGDHDSEKKFEEILKAFKVLGDDQKRKVYDQFSSELPSKTLSFQATLHGQACGGTVVPPRSKPEICEGKGGKTFMESESSMKQNESVEFPGYLCISNGYEIFCLDLKEGKNDYLIDGKDMPLIPKIGTLNLIKNNLPASVGLFNFGSKAYMIGGQMYPDYCFAEGLQSYCLYERCFLTYGIKASSRDIYTLSMVDPVTSESYMTQQKKAKLQPTLVNLLGSHRNNPKLQPTVVNLQGLHRKRYTASNVKCPSGQIIVSPLAGKSDIPKLKKPKFWPIVEKIDGQIHVIDSVPMQLNRECSGWRPSHEVFRPDHDSWSVLSGMSKSRYKDPYICSHLVVGHRLYATSKYTAMVFDSKTGNWEAARPLRAFFESPFVARDVWNILEHGIGRCVRGITYGEPKNPLHVVIAVVRDYSDVDSSTVRAVAYLVTSSGKVVCFQSLPCLLEGPVSPLTCLESGTFVDVDDKGSMCFVMNAFGYESRFCTSRSRGCAPLMYALVGTFTVEGLTEADSKVCQVWAKGEAAWPVEKDFVRVHVKGSSVYHSSDENGFLKMVGVQACFLPGSAREE